jgi:hypothetical protein
MPQHTASLQRFEVNLATRAREAIESAPACDATVASPVRGGQFMPQKSTSYPRPRNSSSNALVVARLPPVRLQ